MAWMLNRVLGQYLLAVVDEDFFLTEPLYSR